MSAEIIEKIRKAEAKVSKHTRKTAKWKRRVFELLRIQQEAQQKRIKEIEAWER